MAQSEDSHFARQGDLALACVASLLTALGTSVVPVAGLVWAGLQGVEAPSAVETRGSDGSLILLSILVGSLWVARRGSPIGLRLWPAAVSNTQLLVEEGCERSCPHA